jgi:hypothetical protein
MITPMFRNLSFLLMVLSAGGVCAQNKEDASSWVSTKINLVAFGEDIPGLVLSSSNKKKTTTALAFTYSKPLTYHGPSIVEISQTISDSGGLAPPPKGLEVLKKQGKQTPLPPESVKKSGKYLKAILKRRESSPDVVALAEIPRNAKFVTILLARGENGTYQTHVINDDPSQLPPGKLVIHNYINVPLALRFNSTPPITVIKPHQSTTVTPKNGIVIYELAYPYHGKWKTQENNMISIKPTEQVRMILLQNSSSFFTSSDGSRTGKLQLAILRRNSKK